LAGNEAGTVVSSSVIVPQLIIVPAAIDMLMFFMSVALDAVYRALFMRVASSELPLLVCTGSAFSPRLGVATAPWERISLSRSTH
jgi:hypothetical protein